MRSRRPEVARLRSRHRFRRRQLALPRRRAGSVRGRRRRARQQVRVARHVASVRRLHLRVRGDRARLDLGARLSLRARLLDLHRRMFGRDLARVRLRHDVRRTKALAACENLFAKYLDGHRLAIERLAPRRLGRLAQLPAASSASAGRAAMSSCSATPRTPRISRSARGPSSRSRTRSSSPRC